MSAHVPPPPQLFDRLAKGIREAPSKALMGQLAEAGGDDPAAAFALRQSLATLGALGGALAASAALRASGYNYALVFGLAWVPAAAALALLAAAFGSWGRPPGRAQGEGRPRGLWRFIKLNAWPAVARAYPSRDGHSQLHLRLSVGSTSGGSA